MSTCTAESWEQRLSGMRITLGGRLVWMRHAQSMERPGPITSRELEEIGLTLAGAPESTTLVRVTSDRPETAIPRLMLLPGWVRYVRSQYRLSYIDIQGSFEEYLRKFSPRSRSQMRRKVRRFRELARRDDCLREYSQACEMDEFHRLAFQVSEKSYQGRRLKAGIGNDDEFRAGLLRKARRGEIRGYILFAGESPVAYALCRVKPGALSFYRTGFDPALADASPGTVLLLLMLESIFAKREFGQFDFGTGDFDYKAYYATGSQGFVDIAYLRRTVGNYLFIAADLAVDSTSRQIKKALCWFGCESRIRKALRQYL